MPESFAYFAVCAPQEPTSLFFQVVHGLPTSSRASVISAHIRASDISGPADIQYVEVKGKSRARMGRPSVWKLIVPSQ
jgi:hypothetical protein